MRCKTTYKKKLDFHKMMVEDTDRNLMMQGV